MSPAARGCCNVARVHDLVEGCYIETKFVLSFYQSWQRYDKKGKIL